MYMYITFCSMAVWLMFHIYVYMFYDSCTCTLHSAVWQYGLCFIYMYICFMIHVHVHYILQYGSMAYVSYICIYVL